MGYVLTIINKGNVLGLPHGLVRPQPLCKVIHVSQPLELFQLLALESHCRCPTTSHLYIRNGSYMSFHWSTCCFFWQMISRTHLLSVSTGLQSYSTFLCSWLKYIISLLIAQVSFCDHLLLLEWSWCCTSVRYTYCLCVCDLFEGILLYLRNGELICKHQLRKEKPELHRAMNTNYFLFPSLTLGADW